ncbi:MAG: sterol desaturase family protein [Deltaproteobacteria bacterium]|nr:sterol desaturase family protein [Deltaproteobacteria bacterium]
MESFKQKLYILAAVFTVCIILENAFPLRRNSKSKIKRLFQNLVMAATSAVVARFTSVIIVLSAARTSSENKLGLLPVLSSDAWPFAFRICIEVIILDYLIYLWHRLNHVVPFLWRFHQPHHLDHEMDASTALRFHFFEIVLSGLFRASCILAIGFSIEAVLFFEVLVTSAAIFHHSNLKIPIHIESKLGALLITPRRHWVHHLPTKDFTNSCYGTVFSIWDLVHRSLKPLESDPQKVVGVSTDDTDVPASRKPDDLLESLLSPFTRNL